MEKLGEAYAQRDAASIKVPVASGYELYLMLFEGSGWQSITITTSASVRRYNTAGYVKYDAGAWSSDALSNSVSTDSCRFINLISGRMTGYVWWRIIPREDGTYDYGAQCYAAGSSSCYMGGLYGGASYELGACTPISFALSGPSSYTHTFTGVTVYGIK